MATLFDQLVAVGQAGRIKPQHYTPIEGEWCMVLGSDAPGLIEYLTPGDFAIVRQVDIDWSADVIRVVGMLRLPEVPSGYHWNLGFGLNGYSIGWSFAGYEQAETQIIDLAANVTELVTTDLTIGIQLVGPGTDPVLLEIPAFYVDVVSETAEPDGVSLLATFPADGQTGVPADIPTGITLSIAPHDSTLVDQSTVSVLVNGVPAVTAGAVVLPFAGSVTDAEGASSLDTLVLLTSGWGALSSEQTVTVDVSAETIGGAVLNASYSFEIIDFAPPALLAVRAIGPKQIELTFSEPVQQLDAIGASDALNPGNYLVTATSVPAASVVAVSVTPVSSTVVVLGLAVAMSFAPSTYEVAVSGVSDLLGNEITAPDNLASLDGFAPDWPECRSFTLWDQLAGIHRNSDLSGDLFKLLACLQDVVDQLIYDIDMWPLIFDPDSAEERHIDAMLIGLGNPFPFLLDLPDKRLLIASLVPIYKSKGTKTGLEDAVFLFLGFEIEIVPLNNQTTSWTLNVSELGIDTELFTDDTHTLYTFDVYVAVDINAEQLAAMLIIINYMKVAHEHIGTIHMPSDEGLPNYWLLGVSELDENTELAQNG